MAHWIRRHLQIISPLAFHGAVGCRCRDPVVSHTRSSCRRPDVLAALREVYESGELKLHLLTSSYHLATGFGAGALLGLLFGVVLAVVPALQAYLWPMFNAIRQVPSIAFIPILILLIGINDLLKILVVGKATFFPVALATFEAVKNIPRGYLEVGRVYQLPPITVLTRIMVPATIPAVMTGLRLGLGKAWGVLVAAELFASEAGLGQMMESARQLFRIDVVMVGVILIGLIGFSLDRGFAALQRRFVQWQ